MLTCPTTACFNLLDRTILQIGPQDRVLRRRLSIHARSFGRKGVGDSDSVGRIRARSPLRLSRRRWAAISGSWAATADSLAAAEKATRAASEVPGVILPFPGGVASSGSKAGSRYKFSIASTYEAYCPTLRDKLGDKSKVPAGVTSIQEIIINGRDLPTISQATQAAIAASVETPGLVRISAGNYGGRLGKSFVYLRPEKQP